VVLLKQIIYYKLNLFIILNNLLYVDLNNYGAQLTCKAHGNIRNWDKKAGQITVEKEYEQAIITECINGIRAVAFTVISITFGPMPLSI
jgi:hypothetical protein